MANSTFITSCNKIAMATGQALLTDNTAFDNDTMDKISQQIKYFYDVSYREIMVSSRFRFLRRDFTITTIAWDTNIPGNNKYQLSDTITPERLVRDSFFVTSPSANAGPSLKYLPISDYRNLWPGGDTSIGTPRYVYLFNPDGSGHEYVGFSSNPDQAYTITYSGYLEFQPLVAHGDLILIPPQYEHVVWRVGQRWVEVMLSEGKAPEITPFIETIKTEIALNTLEPPDDPPGVDIGLTIRGIRRRHRSIW